MDRDEVPEGTAAVELPPILPVGTDYDARDAEADGDAAQQHRAKRGDLWRLGDHRLPCGDATDADGLGRVLANHPAP